MEDERDERGSAIHLRGDCATGRRGESIACKEVSHRQSTHEHAETLLRREAK